jgi:nucleotide-binding universal stress UspA family protein
VSRGALARKEGTMGVHDVVIGVDLGEPSLAAAEWAAAHLAGAGRTLLVHVVCVPQPPSFLRAFQPPAEVLLADARRGAEVRLAEACARPALAGATPMVLTGNPDRELLAAAREQGARLLVVGPHAPRSGLARLLGGTAERVARQAPCGLLLARGLPPGPPATVLVAVDDSPAAGELLAWAAWAARRFGARVAVLTVVPVGFSALALPGASPTDADRVQRQFRDRAEAWLRTRAAEAGLADATLLVAYGDPGLEALSAARRIGAELLVIGRHGTGHSGGPFLGSVAEFLLRNGSGPVLLAAGPPPA